MVSKLRVSTRTQRYKSSDITTVIINLYNTLVQCEGLCTCRESWQGRGGTRCCRQLRPWRHRQGLTITTVYMDTPPEIYLSTTELSTQAVAGTACPAASPASAAAPGSQAGSAPPSADCGSTDLLVQQYHPHALPPVQHDKDRHADCPESNVRPCHWQTLAS